MPILNFDQYLAAAKQTVALSKTQTAVTVAAQWHTLWDRAGNPGAGSLAVGNTANGLVPTDATAGAPIIDAFGATNRGYLTRWQGQASVAGAIRLVDRLFHVGSIALNALATTTLTARPGFASRVSVNGGSARYIGTELWIEINAAVSATATTVSVTYTNQSGVTGRATGASASLSGFITGRMIKLPLQAGDSGVQAIEAVVVGGVVATSGTVNILILRPLLTVNTRVANAGWSLDLAGCGMAEVFTDSCLMLMCAADGTTSPTISSQLDVSNG